MRKEWYFTLAELILKLAFKSNGFLKLAQWIVSSNIKVDIVKAKAKP